MTKRTLGVLLALTAMLVSPVFAQVEEGLVSVSVGSGARALGMGGAFIAVADDATASSWNPAGLYVLEKAEASVVYQPYASYRNSYSPVTTEIRSPLLVQTIRADAFSYTQTSRALDFASLTFPFRVGRLKLVPQLGYQRVVDLGLDGSYERQSSTVTSAGSSSVSLERDSVACKGGIDVVAASLGMSFTEKLALGVAVNMWRNGFDRTRTYHQQVVTTSGSGTTRSTHDRDAVFNDDYSGKNFTIGFLAKPTRWLRLAGVYKTAFTMDYEYGSYRVVVRTKDGATPTTTETDVTKTGPITWPKTIGAGFAIQPTDALTVSADLTHSAWSKSTIDETHTQVNRALQGAGLTSKTVTTWPLYRSLTVGESAANPRQADGLQMRLGAEYVVLKPGFAGLTGMPLRFGVFRDRQTTKNTPDLGDVYHLGLTGGLGFVWSRLSLDFAYVHTRGDSKCCEYETTDASGATVKQTQDGTDAYRTHRVFVSSTVRF